MSAAQFMEALFGKLANSSGMRTNYGPSGAPDTRRKLLNGLAEKGFSKDQLVEMQKIIDAETATCSMYWPSWPMPKRP